MDKRVYFSTDREYRIIRTGIQDYVAFLGIGEDEKGNYILIRPNSKVVETSLKMLSNMGMFYIE